MPVFPFWGIVPGALPSHLLVLRLHFKIPMEYSITSLNMYYGFKIKNVEKIKISFPIILLLLTDSIWPKETVNISLKKLDKQAKLCY